MRAESPHPSSDPAPGTTGRGERGERRPGRRRRDESPPPGRRIPLLARQLVRAWRMRCSVEEALPLARAIADEVREGRADLDEDYGAVSLAAEVLWDAEAGRVDEALELIEQWRTSVQRAKRSDARLTPFQVLARDVRAYRLTARALHRKRESRRAWAVIRVAHRLLCAYEGGCNPSALVATRPFDGVGLLYTELLGIAPAVGRRLAEPARRPLMDVFMRDAEVVARQIPLRDPRHTDRHALVNQLLFAVMARGDVERDSELVQLLFELDVTTTRPRDMRGQATLHNLNSAVAEYFGEHENAELYRRRSRSRLRAASLGRHLDVIAAQYPLRAAGGR